jgi:hypothetical protein
MSSPDRAARARLVAVHAALLVAIWLFAAVVYAVVLAPSYRAGWVALDLVAVAGCVALVLRLRSALGFTALGERRLRSLLTIVAISTFAVLCSQGLIPDRNGIWLDESNYLETLRGGEILRHGVAPFASRWLLPFLAGRWNVLPVDDAAALKALNFASLVVTCVYLTLLLVRLGVARRLALAAPLFLLSSYLGVYAASNRLVIDAFNYMMFVLLLHTLLRREHWRLFSALLLLACCNSEKAIVWVPLVPVTLLLEAARPWRRRDLVTALTVTLQLCGPALLYLVAMHFYMAPARTEWSPCLANLHLLSFSSLGAGAKGCAQGGSFRALWFPFGPFTVFALLGFVRGPRTLRPIALLLLPVFLQALAATDSDRMVAYAFIVYLPLGMLYLDDALGALPGPMARAFFLGLAALTVAQHFLLPAVHWLTLQSDYHLVVPANLTRLVMSGLEVLLVGALLFVRHALFDSAAPAGPRASYTRTQ